MDGFQRILGPDRYPAFVSLAGRGLGNYFDEFGAQERTVKFWRMKSDKGEPVVYASDARKTGPSGGGGLSGPRDLDNLPRTYRWMKKFSGDVGLLPPLSKQP